MYTMIEILKSIAPMMILAIVVYLLFEKYFSAESERRNIALKLKDRDMLIPQRFQAYERMALFLERIRPTSLVRRIDLMQDADMYEYALVNSVQEEFDHNISQQIYIEPETWKVIFSAKNTTQNFIKQCRETCADRNSSESLRDELIKRSVDGNSPSNMALLQLQVDIQNHI